MSEALYVLYYFCPHCDYPVFPRQGNIYRHCFAHKKGADCKVSSETALHDGAKRYLHRKLQKNEPLKLKMKIDNIQNKKIREVFESMKIYEISFTTEDIIDGNDEEHYLEYQGFKKIPDVYTKYNSRKEMEGFAWEIYVTHTTEDGKVDYFDSYNISFIEIEPKEQGQSDYEFEIISYANVEVLENLSDFECLMYDKFKDDIYKRFKDNIDDKFREELYNQYKEDFKLRHTEEFKRDFEDSYIKEMRSKLLSEIMNRMVFLLKNDVSFWYKYFNRVNFFGAKLSSYFSTEFGPMICHFSSNKPEVYYENCVKINYDNSNNSHRLIFNNKYSFNKEILMLGNIYYILSENGLGKAVLNKENQIIGFNLSYSDIKSHKIKKQLLILPGKVKKDTQYVTDYMVKGHKKGSGNLSINGNDVMRPTVQLKIILEFFKLNFRLELALNRNQNGQNSVEGIKVAGLTQERELLNYLISKFSPSVIETIKSEYYND